MGDVIQQRTLKNVIGCCGTGLHTGDTVAMTLRPGEPNTGIVFIRTDIPGARSTIAALWRNISHSHLSTTLKNDRGAVVGTVEHLLAAFAGCRIDNAVIEINGPEVPIMDGSAAPFVFLIECAGITEQAAARRMITVHKPISVGKKNGRVSLNPGTGFSIEFAIDFPNPTVSRQEYYFAHVDGAFKADLSRARTFGFEHEVVEMRTAGLLRGGSLDNAIVVSGETVLNEGGLRYGDEFVRHKILDCLGDLYLAGAPLLGHVQGLRSGHKLNHQLLRALFADADAWSYVDARSDDGFNGNQGPRLANGVVLKPPPIAATA